MNTVFAERRYLPVPRDRVFAFFATPRNLEAITPPWLSFRIERESAPEPGPGVEYTYRLRLHGVPLRWVSRIEQWVPGARFVDVQLRGPYARWHHTHTFEAVAGGTLIGDVVSYRLPCGRLGRLAGGRLVAGDVRRIFRYRGERVAELLAAGEAGTCAR